MTVTQKALSAWTEVTDWSVGDYVPLVIDVATTPKSRRISHANLLAHLKSPIVATQTSVTGVFHQLLNNGGAAESRVCVLLGENANTANAIVAYWSAAAIPAAGAVRPAMMEFVANSGASGGMNFYCAHASAVITWAIGTADEDLRFDARGNVMLGCTAAGTSAVSTLVLATKTAPSTSPADAAQMYSADQTGGNACLHARSEAGHIVKLFSAANIADPSGGTTKDAEARSAIAAILNLLEANGLMLAAA